MSLSDDYDSYTAFLRATDAMTEARNRLNRLQPGDPGWQEAVEEVRQKSADQAAALDAHKAIVAAKGRSAR